MCISCVEWCVRIYIYIYVYRIAYLFVDIYIYLSIYLSIYALMHLLIYVNRLMFCVLHVSEVTSHMSINKNTYMHDVYPRAKHVL